MKESVGLVRISILFLMLLHSVVAAGDEIPELAIGVEEARVEGIETKGNINTFNSAGALEGPSIIVISQKCSATWAAAGYCVAGVIVAIMIVDSLNGVNPIVPGSTLDNISSGLDASLGKPGAKTKNAVDDLARDTDKATQKFFKEIPNPF